MTRDEVFPSKYLKGSDIPPAGLEVTIVRFELEQVGREGENKGVVYFKETKKGVVLNRINFDTIAGLLGDNTDEWPGGRIGLFATPITFDGVTRPAIRVRQARPVRAATRRTIPATPVAEEDDVSFGNEEDETEVA